MESIGTVKSTHNGLATVMTENSGCCCDVCTGKVCSTDCEPMETEAINDIHASIGQKVRISVKASAYIKSVLTVFVLPMAALFLGGVFGNSYMPVFFPTINREVLSVITGFLTFFLSFGLISLFSRRIGRNSEYKPVITQVIKEDPGS